MAPVRHNAAAPCRRAGLSATMLDMRMGIALSIDDWLGPADAGCGNQSNGNRVPRLRQRDRQINYSKCCWSRSLGGAQRPVMQAPAPVREADLDVARVEGA